MTNMSSFRIRPRFEQVVALAPDAVHDRLVRGLSGETAGFEVKAFPGYICLRVPARERNFWSPRLTLSLEAAAGNATRIEGIYGPNANLWSFYLFGYLVVGLLGMFAGFLGAAQLTIESYPWGLWVSGAMALAAALLYVFAQLGQKFGAWQTFQLHQAYQKAIGEPADIR